MEEKIKQLQNEIEVIKQRNQRVEADKAWETSWARIGTICLITYATAALVMRAIGVTEHWTNALIPTVGFFLSTLSLPAVKRWWLSRRDG